MIVELNETIKTVESFIGSSIRNSVFSASKLEFIGQTSAFLWSIDGAKMATKGRKGSPS